MRTVEQADARELGSIRWSCCTLTGEELRPPIVACELGALYNRESVLRFLLGKLSFPFNNQEAVQHAFGHITSLRSVFDVRLTPDPSVAARGGGAAAPVSASAMAGEATADAASSGPRAACFACPIVHCVADGRVPFVAMRPCGCVVSKRALKHLSTGGTDAGSCPVCGLAYSATLPLNGSGEEVSELREALHAAAASKKRKKEKKQQKRRRKDESKEPIRSTEQHCDSRNPDNASGELPIGPHSPAGAAGPDLMPMPPPPKRPKAKASPPLKAGGGQSRCD